MLENIDLSNFNFEETIKNFAAGLFILIIGWSIINILVRSFKNLLTKKGFDATLTPFLSNILRWVMRLVLISIAISTMGVATASLTAVIGAASLAIGLALQGTLGHFASGIILLMTRPIKVGDFVEVNSRNGIVKEIRVFQTILETIQGNTIYVPNGNVIGNAIVNVTEKPTRRIDVDFGIGYNDDISLARKIILNVIENDARILEEPSAMVPVTELKDSSVNLQLRAWVNSADYWSARFELIEKIKVDLDANNITIPYPQSEILFKGAEIKQISSNED